MHLPTGLRVRGLPWLIVPAAAVALAAGTLAAGPAYPAPAAASAPVNVTVNANENLGVVPPTAYGLNQAVWDSQMNAPASATLLSQASIGMMRYPGGSYGDQYDWQTNTVTGGYVAPGTDFDQFMSTVKAVGAQPILIANYGSGTPQEAADWVQYANITKGYGVKYWEIGNEIYGNGYYSAAWETDNHASKSPATYANNVLQYAAAMKAVDPTIKIGAVLTIPGSWPDGVVASGDSADWNHTVLSIAGSAIDFAIVHWYPGDSDPASMLGEPAQTPGLIAQLRQEIDKTAGPNGPHIAIAMTELNSNVDKTTQPDALFAADTYMSALESGVFTVDWWDTRNGAGSISTAPDGATDYNDYGVFSSGQCVGTVCEPPMNTPFPTYYAISMLSKLARPGDAMVRAGSDQPLISVHAARQANGNLSVMIVNKDPANSYPVSLHYAGFTPSSATPTVYTYGDEASSITQAAQGTSASQAVPPYSIMTIVLTPASGSGSAVSAPGQPSASNVTDTRATISWPAATGGQVTRYEVYRQFGTDTELLGESTSTSATIQNLLPGTSYTFNVEATDQAGHLSLPSVPVTFTTGTPGNSTCAVSYMVTDGWGSGFIANISFTNTGPNPINGWTLAFTFPTTTESLNSGWNGNWSESGQNVQITNVSWNGTLAPGGGNSWDVGFVGNINGPYPSPTVFTLNGTVCTTAFST
jgi:Cellulose binding domain/Fibronectin type III domain